MNLIYTFDISKKQTKVEIKLEYCWEDDDILLYHNS